MDGIVKPEEFDYFHEMVINQELSRIGARGYGDGLLAGMVIGLPPVLNFGSEELKKKVVPEVFGGKKFISLAISEAFAGSDVAGLKTTAVKTEDGSKSCFFILGSWLIRVLEHWIVNGTKKWITNGHFSDYFTVGCRTEGGFTVILVERGEGVETTSIKTSYSPTAGTAYITFDNVKVPVENTLGPEDAGLVVMLSNFNHERWVMTCASIRSQRAIVEECLKWVNQREVFGRPLVSQAVIRHKLAAMIARVESAQAWLENVTYQMTKMVNFYFSVPRLRLTASADVQAAVAEACWVSATLSTAFQGVLTHGFHCRQIAFIKMYATRTAQETVGCPCS